MQPFRLHSRIIIATIFVVLLTVGGGFLWLCVRSNEIAFLPAMPGAEWIIYPPSAEGTTHSSKSLTAVFRRSFTIGAPVRKANLLVRAFTSATIMVNGQAVNNPDSTKRNWKSSANISVVQLLRTGTNDITACVSNSFGPPALWLQLQTDQSSLGTDISWQTSLAGATWQNARRATQPPLVLPENPLYGGETTFDSVKRVWFWLLIFCAVALILVWVAKHRSLQQVYTATITKPTRLVYGFLLVVIVARTALFINNALQLPRSTGFDAVEHERYVQFIQENHALPFPKDGWEMYQPPLYYLCSAAILNVCGLSASNGNATFALRAVNGVVGLIHCWLALLCLQLLFPRNLSAQAAGLLIAAFLPPHLYLSQYVTNEPLAGLFITIAFYFLLRTLEADKENLLLQVGIGAALGAAMLTKFSALLALPFFPLALGLKVLAREDYLCRNWLRSASVITFTCLLTCGWHYERIWSHSGRPIIGNWEMDSPFAWWQDPGFRTSAYYHCFGKALISPLFCAFHGFADGFYSTLWGDGLASGTARFATRPPWNYVFMNAGYLLAFGISILLFIGFVAALFRFVRQPKPEWLVVLGMVSLFSLGIIYMSLRIPSYAQVKAFYAFPALVPFSAMVAAGWNRAGQKHRFVQIILWIFLLVWTMTVYAAFWIRHGNPETSLVRGIYLVDQQHYPEAIECLSRTLQLNEKAAPTDKTIQQIIKAEARFYLGMALEHQGRITEAIQQYNDALQARGNFPEAMNNLAWTLATSSEANIRNGARAVQLAERACELTHCQKTIMVGTLAAAYAEAGRFDDAAATAEKACALASERGEQELLKRNQELLELYRAHQAYHETR